MGTDFRKPKFHEFLDLPKGIKTKGLTNFISNPELEFEDIIYPFGTDGDTLDIIPSGIVPPNPSGLLTNIRMQEMFEYLETKLLGIAEKYHQENRLKNTAILLNGVSSGYGYGYGYGYGNKD